MESREHAMEALLSQFSFLANQALVEESFDPSQIDDLMKLFEVEAYNSWSAGEAEHQKAAADAEVSMREAEDYLNSLTDSAMEDFWRSNDEVSRSSKEELSRLVRAGEGAERTGHALGAAVTVASKRYLDGALNSAITTMKSTFAASNKVHPS